MTKRAGAAKARYVSAMFTRLVPRYDLMNAIMTLGRDCAWRRQAARLAAPPSGSLALDIATGTGDLALALATSPAQPRVVGLDFSAAMLAAARRKAASRRLAQRVTFLLGDALALPFPNATFAAATMGFGLRNVADIPVTLAEIHRVLLPGARFANLELTPLRPGLLATLYHLYFYHGVPLLGTLITGDAAAYTYLPRSLTHFPPAPDLAALLRAAGFHTVSYRLLNLGTIAIHLAVK